VSANPRPTELRLPKELIEELKLIAEIRGIKYQQLVRIALKDYAASERRRLEERR
jgi:predicted DNA binding CopG/RHH family protein